ncbi:hypothetical protein GGR52DRAFT_567961 [Hypoxylon sp. FL1284]|nr:hypothetical protein GGR52DRAFT_567961 [Hypoxylon sp. FL1284]
MASLKLMPTTSKTREPPPSIFQHPSPAASHASLPGLLAASAALPSAASVANMNSRDTVGGASSQPPSQAPQSVASLLNPRSRTPVARLQTGDSVRTADRTDALWAEMQATLEEVELSASGGTRVFGPEHDRKLAELRAAQIQLAQAWARSETDDAADTTTTPTTAAATKSGDAPPNLKGALGDMAIAAAGTGLGPTISAGTARGTVESTEAARSTAGTASARPGSSGTGRERLGARLEEETERGILLARNRREANDRYFSKIDRGVRDVVEKLEEVAVAMRAVEEETRNVWGDAAMPDNIRS